MPGALLADARQRPRYALFGPAGHPPPRSLRSSSHGALGRRVPRRPATLVAMAPWPLAGNRAQTLGALAYAAAESPPAARLRAELASAQELAPRTAAVRSYLAPPWIDGRAAPEQPTRQLRRPFIWRSSSATRLLRPRKMRTDLPGGVRVDPDQQRISLSLGPHRRSMARSIDALSVRHQCGDRTPSPEVRWSPHPWKTSEGSSVARSAVASSVPVSLCSKCLSRSRPGKCLHNLLGSMIARDAGAVHRDPAWAFP